MEFYEFRWPNRVPERVPRVIITWLVGESILIHESGGTAVVFHLNCHSPLHQ